MKSSALSLFALLLMGCLSAVAGPGSTQLQPITVHDGVLRFADGGEVNLWGVNFQPSLSWEHAVRMEPYGLMVPLKPEALKRMTDESFDQIQRLGSTVIRIHLCPADFFNSEGQLVECIWLDTLDYTLAEARRRGIYVYLTMINEMKNGETQVPAFKDSFPHVFQRAEWMVVPDAIEPAGKYMRALFNRVNPYDRTRYKENPAIALVEPINEPDYVSRETLSRLPRVQQAYDHWLEDEGRKDDEAALGAFRYQATLRYINRMVRLLREEGLRQPVVWNCGWPRNIQGNREVFNAIGDSAADAISFCLYPGQDDLKVPYWKNREDLSGRNYLAYLQNVSDREDWLGWIRGPRFKAKAKVVYEFETFCNQSAYLFPAMAKVFRSFGAQVATLWTYALSGYAPFCAGSHVFNLETTPRKAASFMVAHEVFSMLPRGLPYSTTTPVSDQSAGFALSQAFDVSVTSKHDSVIYVGTVPSGFIALAASPRRVIGTGDSQFITYAGTGIRFLERQPDGTWLLTIMPHTRFIAPHWQGAKTRRWVELDRSREYPLKLCLPGNLAVVKVERDLGGRWQGVACDSNEFAASPATYRITVR